MESAKNDEQPRFRPFEPRDIEISTRLAWEAWVVGPDETEDDVDPRVMEGYVRSFLTRSNWTEVAYDSHGVIGLMFGRIGKSEGGSWAGELSMIPRFLLQRYGQPLPPAALFHFFLTEFKVLVNVPRSDAEINLLIVDSKHRKRGLGKALTDRFLESARKAGCGLVTLYTDDQVSNWGFYERYGFRRVGTFRDTLTSYFIERDAKGIVYALDLK